MEFVIVTGRIKESALSAKRTATIYYAAPESKVLSITEGSHFFPTVYVVRQRGALPPKKKGGKPRPGEWRWHIRGSETFLSTAPKGWRDGYSDFGDAISVMIAIFERHGEQMYKERVSRSSHGQQWSWL